MEEKVLKCDLVAKHFVGEKEGKSFDFWALYVRCGRIEKQLVFDFNKNKNDFLIRECLLNNVILMGE